MNTHELRKKSNSELNDLLMTVLEEQFQLRMRAVAAESPKTHLYGKMRKNIARIKTVMNERNEQ